MGLFPIRRVSWRVREVSTHQVDPPRFIRDDRNPAETVEGDMAGQAASLERSNADQRIRVDHRDLASRSQTGVHDCLVGRKRHFVDRRQETTSHDLPRGQMHQVDPPALVSAVEAQAVG